MLRSPPVHTTRETIVRALQGAGRFDLVQRGVERGVVDPEMRFGGWPLLHVAVAKGAVELARYLIFDRGVDPTVKEASMNVTALHTAVSKGHNEAVLFLINDVPGVDVNAPQSDGGTALMLAALSDNLQVVRALFAKGADMNAKDETGQTAVVHAVAAGHAETSTFLVTAGADWDVTIPMTGGLPLPLFNFVVGRGMISVVKAIVRRMRADGLDGAALDERLEKAALPAVIKPSLPSLETLMEEGLDVAQVHCQNEVAGERVVTGGLLHLACQYGAQEVVAFLMEQGCDALARDFRGRLPHHVAAIFGHLEALRWLLGTVPALHPDLEASSGITALYFAAAQGHLDIVNWLVERQERTLGGRTSVVHQASSSGPLRWPWRRGTRRWQGICGSGRRRRRGGPGTRSGG